MAKHNKEHRLCRTHLTLSKQACYVILFKMSNFQSQDNYETRKETGSVARTQANPESTKTALAPPAAELPGQRLRRSHSNMFREQREPQLRNESVSMMSQQTEQQERKSQTRTSRSAGAEEDTASSGETKSHGQEEEPGPWREATRSSLRDRKKGEEQTGLRNVIGPTAVHTMAAEEETGRDSPTK